MASSMITRHFDHPIGSSATLEMPAGWSRNCYYKLTVSKPTGVVVSDRQYDFASPEEARQAAVARERQALKNGWRPRMAAMPRESLSVGSIHLPSGERIASVLSMSSRTIEHSRDFEPRYKKTRIVLAQEQMVDLQVDDGGHSQVQPGDRFILRQESGKSQSIMACIVRDLDRGSYGNHRCRVQASVVALEDGESEATDPDRQAMIQAGIENADTSLVELWSWLGTRIQDTSERQQVQDAIIRGRAERQARLRREQELREVQERERSERELRQSRDRMRQAVEDAERHRRDGYPQTTGQRVNTEETLRRLSGGTDLSKPKKRKIDLGE